MSNFIPVDERKAEALEEELSHQIFRSVSDFVEFYNSGLISKKHEDVVRIVKEITETFRDIKEKNNRLIIISKQEVVLEESLRTLQFWETIVKAKRETQDALTQKKINENTQLLFDESGHLHTLAPLDDESGEFVATAISNEKVLARKDELPEIVKIIDPTISYNSDVKGYLIPASEFLTINDEFILRIKDLIPQR